METDMILRPDFEFSVICGKSTGLKSGDQDWITYLIKKLDTSLG